MPNPAGTTDTQPPTIPTNLGATAISSSQINLTWTASTDNVGVTGYKIYRNASQVGTSATNSYSDTGLAATTSYTYTVSAYDAAGNSSSQSTSASATTQAVVFDTQSPTTPTNLSATPISTSQINLAWTASTDTVGVIGYKIYRNASQVGTSGINGYADTGLSASTTYSYTVSAYDAAGNNSAQSTSTSATTQAQATATFIPSTRTIDWTHAGIPGGIPSANWPIYKTLSPSGGADDSVAIQSAINAAPAGSVVVLNAGTYKLHRSSTVCYGKSDDYATGVYEAGLCLTDKSVVLRGAGPNQTILQYGDGAGIISMGQTYLSSSSVSFIPVTSTALKGATQLTLKSMTGITVNSYVVVTQTNPTDPADGNPLVNTSGYTGDCSGCGHDLPNNVMTQIDRVTAISGNVITLERPLYFNYSNSPQVYHLPMIENVGLESLRVVGTTASGTALEFKNINLEACAHCWVHDVETDWAVDKSHIYLSDVYGSEISNNYLYEAFNHNSGADYALLLEFRNSENLIQNNIIRKARHSTPQSGSSGNVYGYNYEVDAYMGEYHNSLPETQTHSPHPFMNLWEGNVTPNWEFDFAHGSSSHNTMFRNYINLTSTDPDTGNPMTGALIAINVAYYSNYENVVGNVFGPYGSTCTASAYEKDADASEVNGVIYQLGYYDDGGSSSPNLTLSAKVGQTILRGGNWDCKTNSVVWSSNVPTGSLVSSYLAQQLLPTSLYLSATPSWFTHSSAVWPPIDTGATTKVNKLPAQICYENGPKTGAAFNPSACYEGVNSEGPEPPTALSVTVH
jgi:chitodextrinase